MKCKQCGEHISHSRIRAVVLIEVAAAITMVTTVVMTAYIIWIRTVSSVGS